MKELGLESSRTNSKKNYLKLNKSKKEDLVRQSFKAFKPNETWVSDTTSFKVNEKWYFICAILDLYSRKVVSYKISPKHSSNLISSTFKIASSKRKPSGLNFHSDRGTQYTASAFTKLLENLSVKQSFSPSWSPYHNAVMESFFATLKKEEIYRSQYSSLNHFKDNIEKYMNFYNNERPHSTINFKTPNAYEQAFFDRNYK